MLHFLNPANQIFVVVAENLIGENYAKERNDIINLRRQAEDSGYSTARDYTTTRYHEEKKDASNMSKEMNICHLV